MPETMESARRWSGYVCPDCRFVFRVPRDHDGRGVVCPSCRRMLRIPIAGDRIPPLVVPLKSTAPEELQVEHNPHHGNKKRKRKKSRRGEDHAWDSSQAGGRKSGRKEKRQMVWMLVGGGCLFALIVGGVLVSFLGGDKAASQVPVPAAEKPAVVAPAAPAELSLTDAAFLAQAEPLAGKFMAATRIEDMLPLVRNPQVAEARMRAFYPDGKIEAPGMTDFNTRTQVARKGAVFSVQLRTKDFDERSLAFALTPEGLRIDWESYAGWSEMPWKEFLATKPTAGRMFRVKLSPVDYYNFGFADDKKWQSYRLDSPDDAHSIFGYVEKGSVLDARIRPQPDVKLSNLMLSLKFPANSNSDNQVLIDSFIGEGWVLETEPTK